MRNSLILLSAALVTGVVIGIFIQTGSNSTEVTASTSQQNNIVATDRAAGKVNGIDHSVTDITELDRRLQNEIAARMSLEKQLAELSQKISDLELKTQLADETTSTASNDNANDSPLPGSNQAWFNEQALIDNGISSSQASALKTQFEQLELERLYLRDQSIREGWDRDEYGEALQALTGKEDEIKNQLSESEYDSYLYASGQTNRVAVTSVLENAPGAAAGIEPGDHIIRYDNQRIYNWFELREATSTGETGEMIAVEVDRDGDVIELYLARGPLGIRMNSISLAPGN